jgi:hypothetical protein
MSTRLSRSSFKREGDALSLETSIVYVIIQDFVSNYGKCFVRHNFRSTIVFKYYQLHTFVCVCISIKYYIHLLSDLHCHTEANIMSTLIIRPSSISTMKFYIRELRSLLFAEFTKDDRKVYKLYIISIIILSSGGRIHHTH